jgi:hypothetical protein
MRTPVARLFFALAAAGLPVIPAAAQLPDPWVVPRGALRVSLQPWYASYDQLFDSSGTRIPLGAYLSADSLGAAYFTTLVPAEQAVRAITGDSTFRFDAGAFRARLDADIRRFPFSIALGISHRLTVTATVPLVTTRVNAFAMLDTTDANAGWNQVTDSGAVVGARDSVTQLLADLTAAVGTLEAAIASGQWDCPTGPTCDQARALAARIPPLAANLVALVGMPGLVSGDGTTPVPPFAPLAESAAGQAILQAVADVSAELVGLGLPPLSGSLPLPSRRIGGNGADPVLGGAAFGYDITPLSPGITTKLSGIGDIELGVRYALAQGPVLRAVLGAIARLPTGKRDGSNDLLDIGTGDHQLDLTWTLDAAFEPGTRLGLWLGAAWTMQLPDQLSQRVTRLDHPVALAATETIVHRNLGDVLRVSANPAVRLTQQFRVFVSASYYRKGADSYSVSGTPLSDLAALTSVQTWGFGAGLWYHGDRGKGGAALPIDAHLWYNVAYFGKGGAAPKTSTLNLGLRLYYNLWGARPAAPAPAPPPETPPGG